MDIGAATLVRILSGMSMQHRLPTSHVPACSFIPSTHHRMPSSLTRRTASKRSSGRTHASTVTASLPRSASSKTPQSSDGGDAEPGPPNHGVHKDPLQMTPALYTYLLQHIREPQVLADLRQETSTYHAAHMQITPEQGQLLSMLVHITGARKAVEVGVFTGYSSLAVAMALPEGGQLVALDRDPRTMAMASKYWQLAGVSDKVDAMIGPALVSLQTLLTRDGAGSYDFAFIDADKRAYLQYFELCLQLLRPGGLIVVDNVLFYGRVADPSVADKATIALREFNAAVASDPRVDVSIVPIGDGLALCRKREAS